MGAARRARWIPALVSLLVVMVAAAPAKPSENNQSSQTGKFIQGLKSRGQMIVGISNAPPNQFQEPTTGTWQGIFPDFLQWWAQQLGVKIKYENTTFAGIVAGVQAGSYDIGSDITATPVRKDAVQFSEALRVDMAVLVVKKATTRRFADVIAAPLPVCAVTGSPQDAGVFFGEMQLKTPQLLTLPDIAACQGALEAGRVAAIFYTWGTGSAFAAKNPEIGLLIPTSEKAAQPSIIGFAVAKTYAASDVEPLNLAMRAWQADPNGLRASSARWKVVSPLQYGIEPLPDWAKKLSAQIYGAP